MRIAAGLSALLLPFAGAAEAKSFAWCQVNGAKYQTYLSDIVEIDDDADAFRTFATGSFAKGFLQYVQKSLEPHASELECNKQETRFYADDFIGVLIGSNPGYNFVKTGWSGLHRAAAAEHRPQRESATEPPHASLNYR